MGVVVRRYIDILTIIINFPYFTCISSFFASSIPTSLFILKIYFFRSLYIYIYRIAGIFRGGKFSRKPLQLYYSNYSRAEFSRNAPSYAKNYPFCTELTVRAALCNHTLARHLFAG